MICVWTLLKHIYDNPGGSTPWKRYSFKTKEEAHECVSFGIETGRLKITNGSTWSATMNMEISKVLYKLSLAEAILELLLHEARARMPCVIRSWSGYESHAIWCTMLQMKCRFTWNVFSDEAIAKLGRANDKQDVYANAADPTDAFVTMLMAGTYESCHSCHCKIPRFAKTTCPLTQWTRRPISHMMGKRRLCVWSDRLPDS